MKDLTLAIRTVYGHWFPTFVLIDENWLKQNLSKIFSAEETGRELRVAAWGTYLHAWDVYKNIFNAQKEGHTPRSTSRVRAHQTSPNIEGRIILTSFAWIPFIAKEVRQRNANCDAALHSRTAIPWCRR